MKRTKKKIKILVQIISGILLAVLVFAVAVSENTEKLKVDSVFNESPSEKYYSSTDLDASKPMVALSFDDGPAFTYEGFNATQEILNVLEYHGVRATFFMCGARINDYNSSCLKREIAIGCEIGNHTYDHTRYGDEVTKEDISKTSEIIKDYCGFYPTIFRCPGGIITRTIREECEQEGMPIAYWSVDTEDWKSQDMDLIYEKTMEGVYDGAIILMHDIYPSTAKAVKKIVPALMKKGYQIVTVSELLSAKNDGVKAAAGQQYIDYNTINNNT